MPCQPGAMPEGYAVDLAALDAAARGIRTTVDQVSVDPRLDHLGAAAGHDQLTHALGEFGVRWRSGVEALSEDGRAIADRLARTHEAYRASDAEAAPGIDGTLRGTGPDPGGG